MLASNSLLVATRELGCFRRGERRGMEVHQRSAFGSLFVPYHYLFVVFYSGWQSSWVGGLQATIGIAFAFSLLAVSLMVTYSCYVACVARNREATRLLLVYCTAISTFISGQTPFVHSFNISKHIVFYLQLSCSLIIHVSFSTLRCFSFSNDPERCRRSTCCSHRSRIQDTWILYTRYFTVQFSLHLLPLNV